VVFQGTGIGVVPDDGAQALKYIADMHHMYVFDRYCPFSWY